MAEETQRKQTNSVFYIDQMEKAYTTMKALASMERLEILNLLGSRSMNVQELASELRLPVSSTSMHVQQLEAAGLVKSVIRPGKRGNVKLCSRCVRAIQFYLTPHGDTFQSANQMIKYELPLGAFSAIYDLRPTCGLGGIKGIICEYDRPGLFYHPRRLETQIMWWCQGFVEYRFPLQDSVDIRWLEFSFEGNPQTASYHAPWKSDISVYINDRKLGVWQSEAERSIRRGFLTPSWWNPVNTQYGVLKTWRVTSHGSYLDSEWISDTTLQDLKLDSQDAIIVRIGIDRDAPNVGGLVLFGENFGDFEQALILRIGYNLPKEANLTEEK